MILFFIRGITQQTRDLPGLALDAGLVCLAGVFLGLVFNNAHYVGPPEQSVCNGIQVEALRARCELPLVHFSRQNILIFAERPCRHNWIALYAMSRINRRRRLFAHFWS